MFSPETKEKIERELEQAGRARQAGNEGQARVCARRAAGAAVGAYLREQGQAVNSPSAIDLLNQALATPGMPDRAREVVEHLLTRVNSDYQLPLPVDLLSETRWLVAELEKLSGQA